MRITKKLYLIFCLGLLTLNLSAQSRFALGDAVSKRINFQLVSNLIIIPVEVNNTELAFVLDTGVSNPILFNLNNRDSLGLKNIKTFYLHGLGGGGKIEALKSSNNKIQLGDAINYNQDLYVVFDKSIDFTPRLGVLVHGILGYDIFRDFIVEINYNSKYIKLYKPESFSKKLANNWTKFNLEIHNKKAYINAEVNINDTFNKVKLLIDTGSSDALWLFEDEAEGLSVNDSLFFKDYLGQGLSGSVYGKRSRVSSFKLDPFELKAVNVAFPDSASVEIAKTLKDRNGSIGGYILKRFNMFIDYTNKHIYLKKNTNFKQPFTYNNSGIVLEHNGTQFVKERVWVPSAKNDPGGSDRSVQIDRSYNYNMALKPIYKIVELRKSSNAYAAGLRIGDILVSINGKQAYNFKLSVINKILYGKTGRTVRLKVDRNGNLLTYKFKLDDAFKRNEPSD